MSLQLFNWRYFFLAFGIISGFFFTLFSRSVLEDLVSGFSSPLNRFFGYSDCLSFYFSLLSLLLGCALLFCFGSDNILSFSGCCVLLSVIFSVICYNTSNSFLFWVCYEMSILFLLVLLILDSPYSERYLASWYFLGYIVFTSLPMFLCILFISSLAGCYDMLCFSTVCYSTGGAVCIVVLAVMFITKIPLFPFHCWLPIVHAEAPSPVSVCLSGYIMKLGVLGLYRFCSCVMPGTLFSVTYTCLIMGVSIVFFLGSCCELDGKRWLAFLSLAHINIVCVSSCVSSYTGFSLPWYFCLGHGISAGSTFIFLWLLYDLSGSRNWLILKDCVFGATVVSVCCVLCLFSVASIPPTLTFFSEVLILVECGWYSLLLCLSVCIYLFFSGVVPLFVLSHILSCSSSVSIVSTGCWKYLGSLFFLNIWMFIGFLVI